MDYLSLIKQPIEADLADFVDLFNKSLMHSDGLLSQVLDHIRQRAGKRMRPMLILLMARNFGKVSSVTQHSAVGLELLHTASLVHDDVVDESGERRGQASVNATYNNKVAVLVGYYILSTALLHHIIMNKRSRMKQFQSHSRMLSNRSYLTKILGHQQDEHRSHSLARTLPNMIERLREKTIAMHQRLVEQVYKISQFRLYRLLDK